MKITKFVHSCLLVEHEGKKALVDPGNFSWDSGLVDQGRLKDIDYVLVTHAHPDHYHPDFCNVVHELSPTAIWYGPKEVIEKLNEQGIVATNTSSELSDVKFVESTHADGRPWFKVIPEHTSFVLFGDLLISGDHQAFTDMHGAKYLAGAFTAPWGSLAAGAKMLEKMDQRPEVYIPVHDWHLNDTHRRAAYTQATEVLGEFGIRVTEPTDGLPFELQ